MSTEQQTKSAGAVRAIVDYGALAVWFSAFVVYWLVLKMHESDALLQATWWLIGGSVASLAVGLFAERRIAPVPLLAGLLAVSMGSLALVFHDTFFVMIKPTIADLIFSAVCFGGAMTGKNPLKAMLSGSLNMSDGGWRKLTMRYGLFFLASAIANVVVWKTEPEHIWVLFKFPGMLILTMLFAATQAPMMMKDMKAVETAAELEL
jgi:intracellular septation protein